MEEFEKEIIKSIATDVYKDTGHEGLKQIGIAFGAMMEWAFQFAYPLRLKNEKRKLEFERNVDYLRQSFATISPQKVIEVAPEIAIPLLQKLTYVSNEEIAKLFVNLLNRAANSDTASDAHPAFVQMIERLSVDEARILNHLKDQKILYYLNIDLVLDQMILKQWTLEKYYTELDTLGLIFPKNIPIYINNFLSMGIMSTPDKYSFHSNGEKLREISAIHADAFSAAKASQSDRVDWSFHFFNINEFGQLFIKACTGS